MNPGNEQRLLDVLRALRNETDAKPITPELEQKLLSAYRAEQRRRSLTGARVWAVLGAVAASLTAISIFALQTRVQEPKISVSTQLTPPEEAWQQSKPQRRMESQKEPDPKTPAMRRPRTRPSDPPRPAKQEQYVGEPLVARGTEPQVTDFVAVPFAPPFAAYDRGQLIRVRMPRQSFRSLGIPVNAERWNERVQADVLMGEDGIARAVRFVR